MIDSGNGCRQSEPLGGLRPTEGVGSVWLRVVPAGRPGGHTAIRTRAGCRRSTSSWS